MGLPTDATVKGDQVTDRLYGLGNCRVLPHHFHIQISVGDIIMRWKYHTCCNSFPYQHHDTRHTDIRLKMYPAMYRTKLRLSITQQRLLRPHV